MKTTFFAFLVVAGLVGTMTGCVHTVDDRKQAGVPFLKDSIEGSYQRPVTEVFDASKAVLARNGVLVAENRINNSLEAKVNQSSVFVRVNEVDATKPISGVVVQVRTKAGA